MHRDFRKLLEKATGVSEPIIAVTVDIRNFTPFSSRVDSFAAALYLKRFFITLIDRYFSKAKFFKSTGDGLLICISYDESSLVKISELVLDNCFDIVDNFDRFCERDKMINFPVPDKVGIGISRGFASFIQSGNKIIDCSGTVLNLSARLMDMARPSGIVIDEAYGYGLLRKYKGKFGKANVFIKGIHDTETVVVYYTSGKTEISKSYMVSRNNENWENICIETTLSKISEWGDRYIVKLGKAPKSRESIAVKAIHKMVGTKNGKVKLKTNLHVEKKIPFEYENEVGRHQVVLNGNTLAHKLRNERVPLRLPIKITVFYVPSE